jgi:serralysin
LSGAGDNDILYGGAGKDTLSGGAGNDRLTGEAGDDCFLFDASLDKGNVDQITDFKSGEDTVQLKKSIFAKLNTGTLNTANFRASANGLAQDSNDFILYNTSTGALLYDADGNGSGAAAIQFATLQNKPQNLTYSAFIVEA